MQDIWYVTAVGVMTNQLRNAILGSPIYPSTWSICFWYPEMFILLSHPTLCWYLWYWFMTPSISVGPLVSDVFSSCWLDGIMSLLVMWDSDWSRQTSLQRTFALSPQLKHRTISSDAPLKKCNTPKGTEPFPSFEWSDHLESCSYRFSQRWRREPIISKYPS